MFKSYTCVKNVKQINKIKTIEGEVVIKNV